MRRIRTKLVFSLLAITVLAALPLYFLVDGLLQKSLEIGFNSRVEAALENATTISQTLFAKYKEETLTTVKALARQPTWAAALAKSAAGPPGLGADLSPRVDGRVAVYDTHGTLRFELAQPTGTPYPHFYQNEVARFAQAAEPAIVDSRGNPAFVSAVAPIVTARTRLGFLLLTVPLPQQFAAQAREVLEVHQMFKTINLVQDDLRRGFLLAFLTVYLPIAALSMAVGYYFSRRITSPLLGLAEATRKVAEGDWNYRVPQTSRDEIGELVAAFNSMIAQLQQQQAQVIALEKMAVWREIARVLAHEIKNPLTPIQLTVQQMKDQYPGDDPQYQKLLDECSEIIADEIGNLHNLVREFSDFARMPQLDPRPGNLNETIQETTRLYAEAPIHLQLHPDLPEIDFDDEQMRRVLINFIQNSLDAIRAHNRGEIFISTAFDADQVVLEFADTGAGIPSALQEKIFEPYFSTKKSGMGLGLAIVRRIIEEHSGEIALQSKEGEGTTFVVRLKRPAVG